MISPLGPDFICRLYFLCKSTISYRVAGKKKKRHLLHNQWCLSVKITESASYLSQLTRVKNMNDGSCMVVSQGCEPTKFKCGWAFNEGIFTTSKTTPLKLLGLLDQIICFSGQTLGYNVYPLQTPLFSVNWGFRRCSLHRPVNLKTCTIVILERQFVFWCKSYRLPKIALV